MGIKIIVKKGFSFFNNYESRARLIFFFALFILAITLFLVAESFNEAEQKDKVVTEYQDFNNNLQGILTNMLNAETGMRGYLATHDARFLEPYSQAFSALPKLLRQAELAANTHSMGLQDPALNRNWQDFRQKVIDLQSFMAMQVQRTSALEYLDMQSVMSEGKTRMDEVRDEVAFLSTHRKNQLASEVLQYGKNKLIQLGLVLVALLDVSLFILAFSFLTKSIKTNKNIQGKLHLQQKLLQEKEATYRTVVESALDAVIVITEAGIIVQWSHQAEVNFGYTKEQAIGAFFETLIIPPRNRGANLGNLKQNVSMQAHERLEIASLHANGVEFPSEWTVTAITISKHLHLSCFIRDITDKKAAEEKIWQQANFDGLTNLVNRRMFKRILDNEIKDAKRSQLNFAVFFLDLDGFKQVNDSIGHDGGDLVLVEAATRLKQCVRQNDSIARMGADEFVCLIKDLKHTQDAKQVAAKMVTSLSQPFKIKGQLVNIGASLGITLYPLDGIDSNTLLVNADQAMYSAKETGKNRYCYYEPLMQASAQRKVELANALGYAIARQEFELHYQPILDLKSGKVTKAEALLRWNHPKLGRILPEEFIRIAEESRLILNIGEWVLHQAIKQIPAWQAKYGLDFKLSINISPKQFLYDPIDQEEHALQGLDHLNVFGPNLIFEITEGVLLRPHQYVTDKLANYRLRGIEIALDDFGTGFSSISYLRKFKVDYLKIDQSYIANIATNELDRKLCEAIVIMAHLMKLKVVAEGIETQAQFAILQSINCDFGQGFYIGAPALSSEFSWHTDALKVL